MTKLQPSVAVVGAGPSGAMAALHLARAGLRVNIIDPGSQRHARIAETLSPEGRGELACAGLWDRLPIGLVAACPVVVSAWQYAEPTWRSFITNPYGCAWHVDRARFDRWLVWEAEEAGASLVNGTVTGIRRADCRWEFDIREADGKTCGGVTDFLVLATGRSGFSADLGSRERIDALCLIAGFSEPMANAGDSLLVEAVANGWWYSAPVSDGRMFSAWMTDAAPMSDKPWCEILSIALKQAPLTRARVTDPQVAFPVGVVISALRPCAGEGWIAVGDTMLARDPISGEGLAWGLRSAHDAARTILRALEGDSSAWEAASIRGGAVIAAYRKNRDVAYKAAQNRWPGDPFWYRRLTKSRSLTVAATNAPQRL